VKSNELPLREILAACVEYGHWDDSLCLWAYDIEGNFTRFAVTDFTVEASGQYLSIQPSPLDSQELA
jgi:hypothetical protein